jgi:hypothetical protein
MASTRRLMYRLVEKLLCMSTLIASAQTVPNPNPAIQNAGKAQKITCNLILHPRIVKTIIRG